jgi:hypothetical protein
MGSALIHADGEMETDRRTDMTIVTGIFVDYANALKTSHEYEIWDHSFYKR